MLLINARMSARSAANWQRLPRTAKRLLACFTAIYAGDHADAERLRALGAPTVIEAGNLKYDAASLPVDDAALASLRQQIGARPCWLAASTHANEEIMIGEVQHMLTRQLPETLCIIVPRHAVRGDSIAADLRAMGHRVAQRSKGEAITADTGIYLADTMGELGLFYSVAPCAFLGGSLIAHGGHNPLEPARLGCAVLSGPHTHNFASIVSAFVAADAIAIVPDKTALAAQLQAWLPAPEAAQAMAERARRVTAQHSGATAAILQRIAGLLP
jgi:3-deoxy-D-manno-octulosonic-acid transferase